MAKINKAGQRGSLGHIDASQGQFREQINALTDAVRQLGGNPEIAPGGATVNDALNSPFILYVNSYTGSDKYVTGQYATKDNNDFESKVKRIRNQRLECGYTPRDRLRRSTELSLKLGSLRQAYFNLGSMCGDNVTIVVASGTHEAINGPGRAKYRANFPDWTDGQGTTVAQLQAFNPTDGGIILPRSCSIISADLRKCRYLPATSHLRLKSEADLSNRCSIFKMTGGGLLLRFFIC